MLAVMMILQPSLLLLVRYIFLQKWCLVAQADLMESWPLSGSSIGKSTD